MINQQHIVSSCFCQRIIPGVAEMQHLKIDYFKGLPLSKQNGTKINDSDLITRIFFIVVKLAAIFNCSEPLILLM